ncbi:MAG: hypothetical protein V2A58_09885 [Planctomycetota bacterium]
MNDIEAQAQADGLACPHCFQAGEVVARENCLLCARNPSAGEFVRFLVVAVAYFLLLVVGRLMILGEAFPGALRFADLRAWDRNASFLYPVDLSVFPFQALALGLFFGALVSIPVSTALVFGAMYGALLGVIAWFLSPVPKIGLVIALAAALAGPSWHPTRRPVRRAALASLLGTLALVPVLLPGAEARNAIGVLAFVPLFAALPVSAGLAGAIIAVARERKWRAFPVVAGSAAAFLSVSTAFALAAGYNVVAGRLAAASYAPDGPTFRVQTVPAAVRAPSGIEGDEADARMKIERVFALLVYFERLKENGEGVFENVAERFEKTEVAGVCRYLGVTVATLVPDRASLVGEGIVRPRRDLLPLDRVDACRAICEEYPSSPVSALAYLELGRAALSQARFAEGRERLVDLVNIYERQVPVGYVPPTDVTAAKVFEDFARRGHFVDEEKYFLCDRAIREARRLLRFLAENADYDAEPLRLFCSVRLSDDACVEIIDGLLGSAAYAQSKLRDNLRLARMQATGDFRLGELLGILRDYPDGDVIDEVVFRLAEIFRRRGAAADREEERHYLSRLVVEQPGSVFYPEALARLKALEAEPEEP